MNKIKREQIFQRLKQHTPTPTTELQYDNDFQLLIAVMLSAQATDVSVNKVTPMLFKAAPTPQKMARLTVLKLESLIKTIGLYRTKAKNVKATCQLLVEHHNGQVPRTRQELEALPGVGRKTANVVLNTAFGEPTMAVDTHIFRLANRINLAPGKNVLEVEHNLIKHIPKAYLKDAHHWLILHGRYVCMARKPRCGACVIEDLCEFKAKAHYI